MTRVPVLILLILLVPAIAHAYLDFGTGSYVLQIIFASFIGFVVVMKNHLEWVKRLFKGKKVRTLLNACLAILIMFLFISLMVRG